jgi:alpha-tubulin suppressor-like RCC1 family protein
VRSGKHVCADCGVGKVYVWGRGDLGQLGLDDRSSLSRPSRLLFFDSLQTSIVHLICGEFSFSFSSFFLDDSPSQSTPLSLSLSLVFHISGPNHCGAFSSDGHLFLWGFGGSRSINPFSTDDVLIPTSMYTPPLFTMDAS